MSVSAPNTLPSVNQLNKMLVRSPCQLVSRIDYKITYHLVGITWTSKEVALLPQHKDL